MVNLPFAHDPFRCAHAERFVALASDASGDVSQAQARAAFFAQLGPADFASCPRHEGDWGRIAAAAVDVTKASPPGGPYDDALAVVAKTRVLSRSERSWLHSLIEDPIAWRPGADEIANGQHRVCALRAAGVIECPVATDP